MTLDLKEIGCRVQHWFVRARLCTCLLLTPRNLLINAGQTQEAVQMLRTRSVKPDRGGGDGYRAFGGLTHGMGLRRHGE